MPWVRYMAMDADLLNRLDRARDPNAFEAAKQRDAEGVWLRMEEWWTEEEAEQGQALAANEPRARRRCREEG